MAKERKASVIYEGNASQLVYAFPFDYLRKKFVKVEDIYTNITELTIGVDYTVEDKQVRLVKGIPIGHSVKIYRETTTDPLVEWQDASVLRSADLSLQEVQLLHLAEETADKVFDSGMSTAYGNPNCWDGQYKRIINALDPIEDGDVVTLRYIKANQSSLLNALTAEGAKQNERLTTTGNSYVTTMTELKNTTTTKASEADSSAKFAKAWAMSSSSPDEVAGNKSAKTWAEEAKSSASAAKTSQTNAKNSQTAAATSEAHAKTSETNAKTSETNAKTSATNSANSATASANSAKAAAQSEENAKTWDPTQYVQSVTELNGKVTVTKGGGETNTFDAGMTQEQLTNFFYPIGSVYMSADKNKTKADFPFMQYGTWEEVPAASCLETADASHAAGSTVSAGLPNLTGKYDAHRCGCFGDGNATATGVFRASGTKGAHSGAEGNWAQSIIISFDASKSNSIYGASTTVQPKAFFVKAWRRTA